MIILEVVFRDYRNLQDHCVELNDVYDKTEN